MLKKGSAGGLAFYCFSGLILLRVFCDTILCSAQPSFLCFLRSTRASLLGCAVFSLCVSNYCHSFSSRYSSKIGSISGCRSSSPASASSLMCSSQYSGMYFSKNFSSSRSYSASRFSSCQLSCHKSPGPGHVRCVMDIFRNIAESLLHGTPRQRVLRKGQRPSGAT